MKTSDFEVFVEGEYMAVSMAGQTFYNKVNVHSTAGQFLLAWLEEQGDEAAPTVKERLNGQAGRISAVEWKVDELMARVALLEASNRALGDDVDNLQLRLQQGQKPWRPTRRQGV